MTTPSGPPPWPNDPPLITLQDALKTIGQPLLSYRTLKPDHAIESFRQFVSMRPLELDRFSVGNAEHLADAYMNSYNANCLIREMAQRAEPRGLVQQRAKAAGLNVIAASQMIDSVIVVHMCDESWSVYSALILLRTSIELAARAAFIALGLGDEATRWEEGPKLVDEQQRRRSEFKAKECMKGLGVVVANRLGNAEDPAAVYRWLCQFTRLDAGALKSPQKHESSYAAIAYIAWACAVMSEVVSGVENIAVYPTVWPSPLPWK